MAPVTWEYDLISKFIRNLWARIQVGWQGSDRLLPRTLPQPKVLSGKLPLKV